MDAENVHSEKPLSTRYEIQLQKTELLPTLPPLYHTRAFDVGQCSWEVCFAVRRTFAFCHSCGNPKLRIGVARTFKYLWMSMHSFTLKTWCTYPRLLCKAYPMSFLFDVADRNLCEIVFLLAAWAFYHPGMVCLFWCVAHGNPGYPRNLSELGSFCLVGLVFVFSFLTYLFTIPYLLLLVLFHVVFYSAAVLLLGILMVLNLVMWLVFLMVWLPLGGLTFWLWYGSDHLSLKLRLLSDIEVETTLEVVIGSLSEQSWVICESYSKKLRCGEAFHVDELKIDLSLKPRNKIMRNGLPCVGIKIDMESQDSLNGAPDVSDELSHSAPLLDAASLEVSNDHMRDPETPDDHV